MTTPASMWDDPDDDTTPDAAAEQALAATEEADLTAPVDAITTTFDDDSDPALDRGRLMAVLEQVISRNGKAVIGDLAHLPEQLGRSRPWLYYTLDQLTVSRALTVRKGKEGTSWTFTRARRVPAGVSGSDT